MQPFYRLVISMPYKAFLHTRALYLFSTRGASVCKASQKTVSRRDAAAPRKIRGAHFSFSRRHQTDKSQHQMCIRDSASQAVLPHPPNTEAQHRPQDSAPAESRVCNMPQAKGSPAAYVPGSCGIRCPRRHVFPRSQFQNCADCNSFHRTSCLLYTSSFFSMGAVRLAWKIYEDFF